MKLSVIIPSYKDPLLQKTIDSLLENSELGDKMEIIAVLDGYWPDPQLADNPRVRLLHLGKSRGANGAINAGVAVSKGEYIMRADSHCVFGKGYDRILLERIRDNWVVTPRRYFLDTEKWEVTDAPPVDYEKLIITEDGKNFSAAEWKSRATERKEKMIDDTMTIQGECWVMKRAWWDKTIKELKIDGYGTHLQNSMEMVFKNWQAEGRLMVNKNTWFAHSSNEAETDAGVLFAHSFSLWRNYYKNAVQPKWEI